jgi:hypothetical protein
MAEQPPSLIGLPLLYVGHAAARGVEFVGTACEQDLEGIVAKRVKSTGAQRVGKPKR